MAPPPRVRAMVRVTARVVAGSGGCSGRVVIRIEFQRLGVGAAGAAMGTNTRPDMILGAVVLTGMFTSLSNVTVTVAFVVASYGYDVGTVTVMVVCYGCGRQLWLR